MLTDQQIATYPQTDIIDAGSDGRTIVDRALLVLAVDDGTSDTVEFVDLNAEPLSMPLAGCLVIDDHGDRYDPFVIQRMIIETFDEWRAMYGRTSTGGRSTATPRFQQET